MAQSDKKQMRTQSMSVQQLVKRISASGSKKDIMSIPETEALWLRTPEALRNYLVRVIYELEEPWRLRGAPAPKTDQNYFDHWTGQRDCDFPELNPNYQPSPQGADEDEEDKGDDGAPSP